MSEFDETDNPEIGDMVAEALSKVTSGSVMLKYVLVVEGMDAEGERFIQMMGPSNSKAWDAMGLLEFALAQEKAHLLSDFL